MNLREEDKIESLENELCKLKTEHMCCEDERRRLKRQLEVKNEELEDLKGELGFIKDAVATAFNRYKRALEYNIEVEAQAAELKTRFEQERGQLLGRLIHFKNKLAEKELELGNFRGTVTAGRRKLPAELPSQRHVNDVKCSPKSRKRKEFAKPTVLSERKLVGENGVACKRMRKFPAYIQKSRSTDFSNDASNYSDNSSSDVGDHKQDTERTKIRFLVKFLDGRKIIMRFDPSSTIHSLKSKIKSKIGDREDIPTEDLSLVFLGKQLEDGRTLAECNIDNECTIDVV